MDEEMDGLIENFDEEVEEIDEEYEFQASRFFDFTRYEHDWEIEEVERWFEVSGDYEPSPFIVKLNLEKLFSTEVVPNASNSKSNSNTKPISRKLEIDGRHGVSASKKKTQGKNRCMLQDAAQAKIRSSDKSFLPRSSTLMKPTASHLAKQNKLHDHMDSNCLCTRSSQRTSTNPSEKSLQSSVRFDSLATKRQKLEMGYLRKMAHLKHHISFLHKSTKKVTVPREPELETLLRAQRRSSKNSSASSEHEKDSRKGCNFKALPLNRKILQASSLPQTRKSTTQLTQSQMFNLKTMERANQHASAKALKSQNADPRDSNGATDSKSSRETLKNAKEDALRNSKARPFTEKEPELLAGDCHIEVPPIEQFTELSLGSDSEENKESPSEKISTKDVEENAENAPDSFKSEFWRSHAKPSQCGGHLRVHETSWSNMNRGLATGSS